MTPRMRSSAVLARILTAVAFSVSVTALWAQPDLGPAIALTNPSFEDAPRRGHAPRGWYDCGFSAETPVDVHPAAMSNTPEENFFGVDAKAFDGNTYIGMVVRDNDTYESVSQRLIGGPLKAGQCYSFSIYLARETNYLSYSRSSKDSVVNYKTPAKLRIFGGLSYCNRGEVIAESAPVKNEEWLQYNFRFEPKRDHAYIVLEAYYKTPVLMPYNGNLLLDAAGKITPIPCKNEPPVKPEPEPEVLLAEVPVKKPVATPKQQVPAKPSTPQPTPVVASNTRTANSSLQGHSRRDLRPGSTVRVDKLLFKADSSAISPISRPVLDEVFEFLTENDDMIIEVGGHTNGVPPHSFCDKLSLERAEAVVTYLTERGISPGRLSAKGYGKRDPLASNRTLVGRKKNQRVEIKVVSMGEG